MSGWVPEAYAHYQLSNRCCTFDYILFGAHQIAFHLTPESDVSIEWMCATAYREVTHAITSIYRVTLSTENDALGLTGLLAR